MDKKRLINRLLHRLPYNPREPRTNQLKGYTIHEDGTAYMSNGQVIYAINDVSKRKRRRYVGGNDQETFDVVHATLLRQDVSGDFNSLTGPITAWEEWLSGTRNLLKMASHTKPEAVWFSLLFAPNKRNAWAYPYKNRKNLNNAFHRHDIVGHLKSRTKKAGIGLRVEYLRDVLFIARKTGAKTITLKWYADNWPAMFEIDNKARVLIAPMIDRSDKK